LIQQQRMRKMEEHKTTPETQEVDTILIKYEMQDEGNGETIVFTSVSSNYSSSHQSADTCCSCTT
jgi:hypothetical protein